MSDEVMIRVDKVSKKYCRNLKRSLRYGLYDLADELLLKRKKEVKLRKQEFWALRNLSFELKRGESLGVIGVNGSGKTTLLKMLQGLIKPSKGSITVRGQVGALISLGAGFQPVLSGRENIFINAAILGVPKREVDRRLDEIVSFADIGQFIDAPVRTYSSGMKTRLGFAVATHLIDPDVLLIDEVLGAGDITFRYKCMQRMKDILDSGATVVFVSHAIRMVEQMCQRTLLLNKGVVEALGPSLEVCQKYYAFADEKTAQGIKEDGASKGTSQGLHVDRSLFEVTQIELLNQSGESQQQYQTLESITVRVHFIAHKQVKALGGDFKFETIDGICVSTLSSMGNEDMPDWIGSGYVDCVVPELPLREGSYTVHIALFEARKGVQSFLFRCERAAELSVKPNPRSLIQVGGQNGLVYVHSSWQFQQTEALTKNYG